MMEDNAKVKLLESQLQEAIDTYATHCKFDADGIDEISDDFIRRLASDSVYGDKRKLRELLRLHPDWNEELDGVPVDVEMDYKPDFVLIREKLQDMFRGKINELIAADDVETYADLKIALRLFISHEDKPETVEAMEKLVPHAYHAGKKRSKILRAFAKGMGVADETAGSEFSKNFAAIADEYSRKGLKYKVFFSVNPAYIMTASNPHSDDRGPTMVSCMSMNSGCSYKSGLAGYARDGVTIIAFSAKSDSKDAMYSRKVLRQYFFYEPYNGLLLQSRLYKTNSDGYGDSYGGTRGEQEESKVLRHMMEEVISRCEDVANLWKSVPYYGNDLGIQIDCASGFGGYPDWHFEDFAAHVAIRKDKRHEFHTFEVGKKGLCWHCGQEIHGDEEDSLCDECRDEGWIVCDCCGERIREEDAIIAYNRYGHEIYVCDDCISDSFVQCEDCGGYFASDCMTYIEENDTYVCESCMDSYEWCEWCEQYHHIDNMNDAHDSRGNDVRVCDDCLSDNFTECPDCGEYFEDGTLYSVHKNGEEINVCESCRDGNYTQCDDCGEWYPDDEINDGLCPDCYEEKDYEDEEEDSEEEKSA